MALLASLLFASCASNSGLSALSGSRSISGSGYGTNDFTTAPVSKSVFMAGAAKPKDKHGMPLYARQDRVRFVRTTAYTSTESDHLQYGALNATGTPLRFTNRVRSAAADWSVYPVGTVFRIKGMSQLFVVDDYGSALTGTGTIDIYTPTKPMMGDWGRRNVEISVLQWGSPERSMELLSKRLRFSHCSQMYASIQKQMRYSRTAANF
jgi:3D (Asp-Asp-Asp) domain-containing protein